MAQTERNPKSITWTNLSNLATDIANLRNVITAGQDISAGNINTLSSLLNNSLSHYHTYDDAYQLATFGNNGDRNNYYEDKNSNPPANRPGNLGNVTAGTDITATHHNNMRDAATFLRTHYHSIDDRTA
jgi:hypothetical protein